MALTELGNFPHRVCIILELFGSKQEKSGNKWLKQLQFYFSHVNMGFRVNQSRAVRISLPDIIRNLVSFQCSALSFTESNRTLHVYNWASGVPTIIRKAKSQEAPIGFRL